MNEREHPQYGLRVNARQSDRQVRPARKEPPAGRIDAITWIRVDRGRGVVVLGMGLGEETTIRLGF